MNCPYGRSAMVAAKRAKRLLLCFIRKCPLPSAAVNDKNVADAGIFDIEICAAYKA